MKKGLLVGVGVIALLALMVWADRRFPAAPRLGVNTSNTTNAASDAAIAKVDLKNLNDQEVTLDQYKGKVVLVNFWATWCEPCRVEIPWMIGFQQKYADKGLTILGVAMDDEGKSVVAPYVQSTQFDVNGHSMTMNYPIVIGNDDIAAKFGGLLGFPTTIVISRDGKVQKLFIGLADEEELGKQIKALL